MGSFWSYTGDPRSSPKDEVRFLINDTDVNNQKLSDGEIIYNIDFVYSCLQWAPQKGRFPGNLLAAAYCADALAAKYAGMADKNVGDLRIAYGQLFKNFQQLAVRLRARATNALVPPWSGGQRWSEKRANYANRDIIQPAWIVNGMNYVGGVTAPSDSPNVGP
jgi:hypothetical protein